MKSCSSSLPCSLPSNTDFSGADKMTTNCSPGGPFEPCILLIEDNQELSHSRHMLLASTGLSVHLARNYYEVCRLLPLTPYYLAVVGISPPQRESFGLLTFVRHTWPHVQILLLGSNIEGIEDYQYDEIVDASFRPGDFIETVRRLSDRALKEGSQFWDAVRKGRDANHGRKSKA